MVSIFAYTGLPGSGKSYTVVEHQVLPALKAGRLVVTNLPVYRDLICQDLGIDPQMLREFPSEAVAAEPEKIFEAAPNGCVLILDEVWRLFPAGLKSNKVPEPFRTVFAEHRHRVDAAGRAMDIVLVTQDLAQISAFARQLVETTFRTTKLTSIGQRGRYRTDVYASAVSGPNPNPSSALRQLFGRYDAKVYRYYKSHTQSEAKQDGADEAPVDKRANVLLRPMMIAAPFVVAGLLWFGISRLWHEHSAVKGLNAVSATPGGRSQTLVVPSSSPAVRPGGGRSAVVPDRPVFVLFAVEHIDPRFTRVYLAVNDRVVELSGQDCRLNGRSRECLYKGDYYDEAGFVEHAAEGPVGTWSVAGGPGVQGAGLWPPGAATQRDGGHGSG